MNVQATPSAAPAANTGTNAVAANRTGGKAAANAKDAAFSAVLGGQQAAGTAGQGGTAAQSTAATADPGTETVQPDDQTLSLLALMQMLQALLAAPAQDQTAAGSSSEQQQSQTLPQLLLQVLSSPSKLSDKLLQDPNLQQWLAQAAALLPTLMAASANPALPANPALTVSAPTDTTKQSALQTLLQFTDIVQKSPDNPIVRHLLADLQKATVPMLANLVQSASSDNDISNDVVKQLTANVTKTDTAQQIGNTAPSAKQTDSLPVIVVQSAPDNQVQQIKAKLEILAAKSGSVTAVMQQVHAGGTSEQGSADESSQQQDTTPSQTPVLPLQDLLKTLQQAEMTVKAPAAATVNAQTFVRDMSDFMVKNMKVSLGDVYKEATISLHPENLGQVDIKITLHTNGQLVAQLTADTAAGKQLLESQLPQLRQALQSQGLQVERLEVAQETSASSGMFQQPRQQGEGGQSFGRESRERKAEIDAVDGEFANDLRTLADHRSEQNDASGSSFDATA